MKTDLLASPSLAAHEAPPSDRHRGELVKTDLLAISLSGGRPPSDRHRGGRPPSVRLRQGSLAVVPLQIGTTAVFPLQIGNGLARRCIVQVSYAIGVPEPLSVFVDTYGTSKIPDKDILEIVKENFDFRPGMITINLDLKRGGDRYLKTDDPDFTWDVVKPLKWEKPAAAAAVNTTIIFLHQSNLSSVSATK